MIPTYTFQEYSVGSASSGSTAGKPEVAAASLGKTARAHVDKRKKNKVWWSGVSKAGKFMEVRARADRGRLVVLYEDKRMICGVRLSLFPSEAEAGCFVGEIAALYQDGVLQKCELYPERDRRLEKRKSVAGGLAEVASSSRVKLHGPATCRTRSKIIGKQSEEQIRKEAVANSRKPTLTAAASTAAATKAATTAATQQNTTKASGEVEDEEDEGDDGRRRATAQMTLIRSA